MAKYQAWCTKGQHWFSTGAPADKDCGVNSCGQGQAGDLSEFPKVGKPNKRQAKRRYRAGQLKRRA